MADDRKEHDLLVIHECELVKEINADLQRLALMPAASFWDKVDVHKAYVHPALTFQYLGDVCEEGALSPSRLPISSLSRPDPCRLLH
jgi:hypothetical protein